MATTETKTVKIALTDTSGGTTTLKLEYPKDNLYMDGIKQLLNDQFNSDTAIIVSSKGSFFMGVESAYYEVITKTDLPETEAGA